MIEQHCEECNKVIARYTYIQDIESFYTWFKAEHNYNEHPRWYHRMFWFIYNELYDMRAPDY